MNLVCLEKTNQMNFISARIYAKAIGKG